MALGKPARGAWEQRNLSQMAAEITVSNTHTYAHIPAEGVDTNVWIQLPLEEQGHIFPQSRTSP